MSYAAASKSIPQYHTSQEPGASWSFGGVPFATIQKNPQLLFPAGDRWWTRQFLLFPLATCSTCYVQSVEDQKYFNTCVEEMMDLLDKVNSPWLHFPKSGLNVVKLMEQKRKAYRMHLEENNWGQGIGLFHARRIHFASVCTIRIGGCWLIVVSQPCQPIKRHQNWISCHFGPQWNPTGTPLTITLANSNTSLMPMTSITVKTHQIAWHAKVTKYSLYLILLNFCMVFEKILEPRWGEGNSAQRILS